MANRPGPAYTVDDFDRVWHIYADYGWVEQYGDEEYRRLLELWDAMQPRPCPANFVRRNCNRPR